MVGFKDVTDGLIDRLSKETDYFDVVSLIGMFGLGKTTLAWKIFNDPEILFKFPVRIWLPVSQEFSASDIFLAILKELTTVTDDIRQLDDQKLARLVCSNLEKVTFFIVFDDVWSSEDWDRLRVALPGSDCRKGKILITSRIKEVGNYASNPRPAEELRFFTQDESWELLRLEALRTRECPPELEHIAQIIARDCDGLPLAIVVIGGILAAKYSASNMGATEKAWEIVSTRVNTYLSENDPANRMKKFISLSYDRLPYHLRACFLYLGVFPEDYQIPVSRLIRMWIGEGFIQQSNEYTLEERGEMYLDDLINRNLVTIDKVKPNGKVKRCRIHDALRDFCRTEANSENENFLQEIKSIGGNFAPPLSELDKFRRISIHTKLSEFIELKPLGHRVRSFVCFSKEPFTLEAENIPNILAAFKLLRVLEFEPIRLTKISSHMYQLVHARYIAMSFDLPTLPAKFTQLWNMQTLIVNTTSRTLDVKADLWKLSQLRHFKTNASATLPKASKDGKYGAELLTLGMISAESCTTELFEHACNLKKLGIRGRLALLLEGKAGSFDSLGKMKFLEKLKLMNDVHPRPSSEGQLHSLPQAYQFPSKLKSLTLVSTSLAWKFMSTIGSLENLEVLKLKDNAFVGTTWKAADGGFRRLEFLQIEETDLAVWEASSHHFPRLRGLVLKNCEKLLRIPVQLADVKPFQMLELFVCRSANASAKDIRDAKRKSQSKGSTFKLSIFPPTE